MARDGHRGAAAILTGLVLAGTTGIADAAPPAALDLQANHANGSVLIVRSVDPDEDSTTVGVVVTTAGKSVQLNRSNSMVLVDGAGGRYRLVPPPDNETVEIPPNSRMTGEMVFSGRVDPSSPRLLLSTNEDVGGSPDNQFTNLPVFRVELPLPAARTGEAAAGAPPPGAANPPPPAEAVAAAGGGGLARTVAIDRQVNHPNGAVLLVRSLETGPDGAFVTLKVTASGRGISLNRANSMQLVDERGGRYRVVPPPDNPELKVPAGTQIEGRLFFAGRLQPGVGRVALSTNADVGGSADSPYTELPEFRVDIPLGG